MSDGDSPVADPLVGLVLSGRFLPRQVIQRMADVVVYDGIEQHTNRAVRIQRPVTLGLSTEQTKKVQSCGPAMTRLAAVAGVVGPIEGGVQAGIPFLVLPPLSGVTLADRLRHGRQNSQSALPFRAVKSWMGPAASVLDAAHSLGTCHGRLTPDSIVVAADGSVSIDGFPLSQLLGALGLPSRSSGPTDQASAFRAPELARGAAATAQSDQYSLAAIVAEALGCRPAAIEKALLPEPDRRFANCSEFASALCSELESPSTSAAIVTPSVNTPLELENPDPEHSAVPSSTPAHPASQGFDLELDAIESESQLRRARTRSTTVDPEDLSDITFTKTGQTLHQSKSVYDRAANLGGVRSSWRRMTSDFKGLADRKRLIASLVIGVAAAFLALWLLQTAWRAINSLVRSANVVARNAVGTLQPDIGGVRATGQQFAERMRGLWEEHVADDEDTESTAVVGPDSAPDKPVEQAAGAGAWPARMQDRLDEDTVREPTDLIDELVRNKGAFLAEQGLGVFDVADPRVPEQSQWLGGFGLLRKPGATPRPLLHGTLVYRAEDGATFVMRYARGVLRDFWCIGNSAADRFVVYANMTTVDKKPVADGAAFVLNPKDAACLALVYTNGEPSGGEWCSRKRKTVEVSPAEGESKPPFWKSLFRKTETKTVYEPPSSIMSMEVLNSADDRVAEYTSPLDQAIAKISEIQKQAENGLRQFVRARTLR